MLTFASLSSFMLLIKKKKSSFMFSLLVFLLYVFLLSLSLLAVETYLNSFNRSTLSSRLLPIS